jgi:hypothetical protein
MCINERRAKRSEKFRAHADRVEREQVPIRFVVKTAQADGVSMVYLLEAAGRYKIGFSADVVQRVQTLNTAHGISCRIVAVAPGSRSDETSLHRQFACYRISREWFEASSGIVRQFAKLPGSMVFVRGYVSQEPPSVAEP